jgi:hypothetical protein
MLLGTSTQATNGLRTSTKNTPSLENDVRSVNEVCNYADTAAKKAPPWPEQFLNSSGCPTNREPTSRAATAINDSWVGPSFEPEVWTLAP